MSNARQVLLEDRVLKLTPAEVLQLEKVLDTEVAPSKRLVEAVQRQRVAASSS